jgi:hypothetical protein
MTSRLQATRVIRRSRKIANEVGNYENLTKDALAYREEYRKLWAAGSKNAGVFGVACPTCHKALALHGNTTLRKMFCACDNGTHEMDVDEALAALGVSELTTTGRTTEVPV